MKKRAQVMMVVIGAAIVAAGGGVAAREWIASRWHWYHYRRMQHADYAQRFNKMKRAAKEIASGAPITDDMLFAIGGACTDWDSSEDDMKQYGGITDEQYEEFRRKCGHELPFALAGAGQCVAVPMIVEYVADQRVRVAEADLIDRIGQHCCKGWPNPSNPGCYALSQGGHGDVW